MLLSLGTFEATLASLWHIPICISLANKQQDCSWPTRVISKQRRSEPRYPHVSYKLLHTHTHMNTRPDVAHTPHRHTHSHTHHNLAHAITKYWQQCKQRERESWPRTAGKGKLLAECTSCFKSQGTYLPPPSHMRGTYLTLSVHLHMHLCLQAFNISVLGQLSTRAVWEVSKYCRDRYEDCYIIALLMMTGTKYYHCSAYTIPVYLEVEGDK